MINTIIQGHTLEVLKTFSDESVNCCITSPPYWGLRDYGLDPIIWDSIDGCEHDFSVIAPPRRNRKENDVVDINSKQATMKGSNFDLAGTNFCLKCSAWRGSLGLEPTPELYIKHLLEIFDEVKRVLKPTGTCWVNLGDSYAGSSMQGGDGSSSTLVGTHHIQRTDSPIWKNHKIKSHIPSKSLVGIPEMFVLGIRDRGWIRRNTIIWYKRNCMPSSAKDRFTVDFEYVFFFTKSGKYWFEQQFDAHSRDWTGCGGNIAGKGTHKLNNGFKDKGRNKRCVWDIPTQSFSDAHFAVFPEDLVEPMIRSGCPEGDIVLDPFAGSGTTLKVAERLNRQWVGIELNPAYIEMAYKRIKNTQKELIK